MVRPTVINDGPEKTNVTNFSVLNVFALGARSHRAILCLDMHQWCSQELLSGKRGRAIDQHVLGVPSAPVLAMHACSQKQLK